MIDEEDAIIIGGARAPMGCFQGALDALNTPQVGATAIHTALEKYDPKHGIASSWIGGNEATIIAMERIA